MKKMKMSQRKWGWQKLYTRMTPEDILWHWKHKGKNTGSWYKLRKANERHSLYNVSYNAKKVKTVDASLDSLFFYKKK